MPESDPRVEHYRFARELTLSRPLHTSHLGLVPLERYLIVPMRIQTWRVLMPSKSKNSVKRDFSMN